MSVVLTAAAVTPIGQTAGGVSFDGSWEGASAVAAWDGIHESYGGGSYTFLRDPSRRGTVARVTLPSGGQAAIEAIHHGFVQLGTTTVYGFAFKFPNGWRQPTDGWGCLIGQLGYPLLMDTNIGLGVGANHLGLAIRTGHIDWHGRAPSPEGPASFDYTLDEEDPSGQLIPSSRFSTGIWHLLVIEVTWATGRTGAIRAWHQRQGETAWTKTVDLRGIPTMQWGVGITGAYMGPDGKDRQGQPEEVSDKLGAYRDRSPHQLTLYNDGMVIGDDATIVAARVQGTPFRPRIINHVPPRAHGGVRYTWRPTTRGGVLPFRWIVSAGQLPRGIRLDARTGALVGRAKTLGRFRFTATLTDGAGSSTARSFTLRVVR